MRARLRTWYDKFERKIEEFADKAAAFSAHPLFLIIHMIWFITWIAAGIEEFPFGLLTMIVSLEAIILSSLILSSTNREAARDRQTLIRSSKQTKETREMLGEIHEDIHEIKDMLEDDVTSIEEIIEDANYYRRRKSDRYFASDFQEPEFDTED